MDWESAKKHCIDRNWEWSLDLIEKCQKEIEDLKAENEKLKAQGKAYRLYNSCNY